MNVNGQRMDPIVDVPLVTENQSSLPSTNLSSETTTPDILPNPGPEKSISSQGELLQQASKRAEGLEMQKALSWIERFKQDDEFSLDNSEQLVDLINPYTQNRLDPYVRELLAHMFVTLQHSVQALEGYEKADASMELVKLEKRIPLMNAYQDHLIKEYQNHLALLTDCFLKVTTIADKYSSKNPHSFPETREILRKIAEFLKKTNYVLRFIERPWFQNPQGCEIFQNIVSSFLSKIDVSSFMSKIDCDPLNLAKELGKIFDNKGKMESCYQSSQAEDKALKNALASLVCEVECLGSLPEEDFSHEDKVNHLVEALQVLITAFKSPKEIPMDHKNQVINMVKRLDSHFLRVAMFLNVNCQKKLASTIEELKKECGLVFANSSAEKNLVEVEKLNLNG